MARGSGIATQALFKHAAKHARLEKLQVQGNRRAIKRSAKAAVDAKARAIKSKFNLGATEFRGVNAIKSKFIQRAQGDVVREKLRSRAGIPLRDFKAKETRRGLTFSVRRGRRSILPSGFKVASIGGHAFTRKGRSRLPIKKRFGPGLAIMAEDEVVQQQGERRFFERIDGELRKEEIRARKRAGLT